MPKLLELSDSEKAKRKPPAPDTLIDAKHDRVHKDPGRSRPARTGKRVK